MLINNDIINDIIKDIVNDIIILAVPGMAGTKDLIPVPVEQPGRG